MPKTTEDIKELLASELFRKGVAKNYVIVNNDAGSAYTYNLKREGYERIIKYSIAFHKKTCEVAMEKNGIS
jgi:hypothetical protein